jgi:hypothetical protein
VEDDSGSGCGKWLLIGIGVFLVLAVLGNLFGDDDADVSASAGSSRSTSNVNVPTTAPPPPTSAAPPPSTAAPQKRWDNEMTNCTRNTSTGLVNVRGQIVNLTNSTQSYYLEVEFLQDDLRIDWTNTIVSNVAPGQRAAWEMLGSNDYAGEFRCRWSVEEL